MAIKAKKKTYTADGLQFKTKALLDFYIELKQLKEKKFITDFSLPTVDEQSKSKYNARKCIIDGNTFDSIMEGKFYIHLKKEKEEGNVIDIALQPQFELQEKFSKNGKTIRAITYKADFLVTYKDGSKVVYDVKGMETADFLLKKKLFDYKYRDLKLVCVQYRASEKKWMDLEDIKKLRKNKKSKRSK